MKETPYSLKTLLLILTKNRMFFRKNFVSTVLCEEAGFESARTDTFKLNYSRWSS